MKRLLPFSFLLLFPFFSKGQAGELSFQNYTTANGLCHNYIQNIIEDSRGFIWIATREGLSRFDGAHFRNFFAGTDTATSFPHNNIFNLVEYKPGHLLFTSSGRPWCMNTLNNTFYQAPAFLHNRHIPALERMADGNLMISTMDTVFICNKEFKLLRKIPSPIRGSLSVSRVLTGDTLLFTTNQTHILYVLSTNKIIPIAADLQFKETEDLTIPLGYDKKHNSVFFSNFWHGLYEYEITGNKKIGEFSTIIGKHRNLSTNAVLCASRHNDSLLLIGTDNGLNILNENTGIIRHYAANRAKTSSITGNIVVSVYRDKAGNSWIGTTEGLCKLPAVSRSILNIPLPPSDAPKTEIYYILKGNDPYLYSGISSTGTIRINKTDNSISRIDSHLVTGPWTAFFHNNTLIIGGSGRKLLASYNAANGSISTPAFLNDYYGNGDIVTLAYRDSYGDEWFSINQGGGLVRHPANTTGYQRFNRSSTPRLRHGYLASATEDRSGNLWFSVNKSGVLLRWDRATKQFNELMIDTVLGIPETVLGGVFYIYSAKSDTLWITYEGAGLVAYDIKQNKARMFTIRDGLPTHFIYSMVSDHKNRIWLGTARGLACYLPDEQRFVTFKKENGLPAEEFLGNAIYFDDDTKTLWTSSGTMLLRIQPDELLSQLHRQRKVYIDLIYVNGAAVDPGSTPYFHHDQNNIQFQFTAVDVESGKDLEYAYQLEGADPGWITGGNERSAIYSSLNPGSYSFRVRVKRKGDTDWAVVDQPFFFTIATPWWKTWWFRSLLLATFAGIVIVVVRNYYRRRLEKQRATLEKQQAIEKERTRIATDMHDDFGASLSRIKFLSEKLQLAKTGEQKVNEDLGKISAYSDEMAEKMGEIVWALNQRYDSSGDLASFCRSYASEYLADKNIHLEFVAPQHEDIRINGEIRRNIFLVMKEALHNIVKHAHATRVEITLEFGNMLSMIIRDNGRGFDEKNRRPFANGLENMRKRMEEIGGKISFRAENGTVVTLSVYPGIQQNAYR